MSPMDGASIQGVGTTAHQRAQASTRIVAVWTPRTHPNLLRMRHPLQDGKPWGGRLGADSLRRGN
jgi:hypothetical protein